MDGIKSPLLFFASILIVGGSINFYFASSVVEVQREFCRKWLGHPIQVSEMSIRIGNAVAILVGVVLVLAALFPWSMRR